MQKPAAQAVMEKLIEQANLSDKITTDSCGLISYHTGEHSDQRMIDAATNRGYVLTHKARKIKDDDFRNNALVIGMDNKNIERLNLICPPEPGLKGKIRPIAQFFAKKKDATNVPDPYYGSLQDFENVLDLLEDACSGILEYAKKYL